jgi:hypothetical protein
MNGSSSSTILETITVVCILLILVFPNSTIGYSSGSRKKSLDNSTSPNPVPLPIPPPGLLGTLKVMMKVSGGTNKPSDFTITVSGNSPKPKSFAGSSSGTSVTLKPGRYGVSESSISGYTTKYSSGCSGTASGGVPIKCTITNKYHGKPSPPVPPVIQRIITITADSSSSYSIPSTFVKVDRFSTNYTIAGKISSIATSRNLITSTIVNDFDKNPNIGYVVSNSSSLNTGKPSLPNPFVSKDMINQKITNETQNAITSIYATNPIGKIVEIKCTFGMILSNYKCRNF